MATSECSEFIIKGTCQNVLTCTQKHKVQLSLWRQCIAGVAEDFVEPCLKLISFYLPLCKDDESQAMLLCYKGICFMQRQRIADGVTLFEESLKIKVSNKSIRGRIFFEYAQCCQFRMQLFDQYL